MLDYQTWDIQLHARGNLMSEMPRWILLLGAIIHGCSATCGHITWAST